ncbi:MAG: sugar ABC transporter ATP-binding protein [Rhodobacteraceae bacterium]|jgi:ribose transport system ATP-binding protein|nr:sugar ABC transporter ATP-binding protein [Paracoccaceae bacterium]
MLLSMQAITKTYPGVTALSDVSLDLAPGEIVGLIGENGAGKSTLMKILGGVTAPSAGRIVLGGRTHDRLDVRSSQAAGVAFVHQELNLFDNLDVAANILAGREPRNRLGLIDRAEMRHRAQVHLDRLGVRYGPDTPVEALSIAERQMLEIAKALSLDARILIMDEPTSSLSLTETDRLLAVLRRLRDDGVAIIYITHRLSEVRALADRVVCLRDGRVAGHLSKDAITTDAMVRLMIGRDLQSLYTRPTRPADGTLLDLRGVRTPAFPDRKVDLALRRGEILGLAGLVGSGRTSLANTVFGLAPALAGEIVLEGGALRIASPRDAIRAGIYLAPEDRKRAGVVLDMTIRQNITLADLSALSPRGLVRPSRETAVARAQMRRMRIKAPDAATPVVTLSGGNQQKVVLGKWLSMRPRVMILDEPTRGIDVGARGEIYAILRELAEAGVGVLMISSDLEEVLGVSDRIAVMHEGRIAGVLDRPDFSEAAVMRLAVGLAAGREQAA